MKLKKYLTVALAGAVVASMVGCSGNTQSSESVNATASQVENKQETQKITKEETKSETITLVDDDKLKIDITGKSVGMFGAEYTFLIENKMDKAITVQSRDMSVDGMMQDPIFSVEIMAGKKAKQEMSFMDIENIDDLKNVEGRLTVMDGDSWDEIVGYNITID